MAGGPRRHDIYKAFDDANWIYHLGLKNTNGRYDRQSVAIEFANELALDLKKDRLYAFGINTPNTIYTGPFLSQEWRGFQHFAQLDEAQVDAGIALTLDICRRSRTRSDHARTMRDRVARATETVCGKARGVVMAHHRVSTPRPPEWHSGGP